MTREEIARNLDSLSHQLYLLGRNCTEHLDDPHLVILGEFLKNTTYTMDSIHEQIEN